MRPRPAPAFLALVAVVALAACRTDPTGLRVEVSADRDLTGYLQMIRVRVYNPPDAAQPVEQHDVLVGDSVRFPVSLTIVPRDPSEHVRVDVDGFRRPTLDPTADGQVRARGITGFIPGRVLVLPLALWADCQDLTAHDCGFQQTCNQSGTCVNATVNPVVLPIYGTDAGGGCPDGAQCVPVDDGGAVASDVPRGDATATDAPDGSVADAVPSEAATDVTDVTVVDTGTATDVAAGMDAVTPGDGPGGTDTGASMDTGGPTDAAVRTDVTLVDSLAVDMAAVDVAPCTGLYCAGLCVDAQSDVAHCGGCGTVCAAPTGHGTAVCARGACGYACDDGYVPDGAGCSPTALRPIGPLSGMVVNTGSPGLRWVLSAGYAGAEVQVCADRPCVSVLRDLSVTGTRAAVPGRLAAGVYFWRIRGTGPGVAPTAWSPAWEFQVGRRDAPRDGTHGVITDVNGDGVSDVLVGAPTLSGGGGFQEFLGGSGPSGITPTTPTATPIPTSLGGGGAQLVPTPDVDGDGYPDLLVGTNSPGEGLVFVYYGGPGGVALRPDRTLTHPAMDDGWFGSAVVAAGDLDGDGYGDIVVGARDAASLVGRVYVFRGGARGAEPAPVAINPSGPGYQRFGQTVTGLGDYDGDGYADVAVTTQAPRRVEIYRGRSSGLATTPAWTINRPSTDDTFADPGVAGGCDLDGDGYTDFIAGSFATDGYRGVIWWYPGGPSGPGVDPATAVTGQASSTDTGILLRCVGDINQDGYDDLAAAASGAGQLVIYPGGARDAMGSGVPAMSPVVVLGDPTGVHDNANHYADWDGSLTSAVSFSGNLDVNRDGAADVVVGSYSYAGNGRAYLYLGMPGGGLNPSPVVIPGLASSAYGDAIALFLGSPSVDLPHGANPVRGAGDRLGPVDHRADGAAVPCPLAVRGTPSGARG